MVDFLFTTEQTWSRADEVVDYLRRPRLWVPRSDYPDFEDWLGRTHLQLKSEAKRTILALHGGAIVGAVVYQPHRGAPGLLEIKNITVAPSARGRHVASFLLRNAEIEGNQDYGSHSVVVDTKMRNISMRAFLHRCGYRVLGVDDLYSLGAGKDVTYSKAITYPPA